MNRRLKPSAFAILIALAVSGGVASAGAASAGTASASTASARPLATQKTFSGNYSLSYQFFVAGHGSGITTSPLSFSSNGTFTLQGYNGGYVYTVNTSTLTFQINSGCVPVYTGVGSPAAGFIGTLKCTLKGDTSETGNWTALPVTSSSTSRHSGSVLANGTSR